MLEWLKSDLSNYKGRIVSECVSDYKSDLSQIQLISGLDDKFAVAKAQKVALGLEQSNLDVIGLDCEWGGIFKSFSNSKFRLFTVNKYKCYFIFFVVRVYKIDLND